MINTLKLLLLLAAPAHAATALPDFAEFEHQGNCQALVQGASSAATIATWNQEKLDELYACSKAGPTPDGFLEGQVVFAAGGGFDQFVAYAGKIGIPMDKAKL